MEIQIENLKAKMRGVELNSYQKGLALDEFEKLITHTEALEQQLRQYNVVQQSEQLFCTMTGKGFCPYENKDGSCNMTEGNCLNHIKENTK